MSDTLIIVSFHATVYKVQTLVDKGVRLTLDLPEGAIDAAALLMACQAGGIVLDVTAVELNTDNTNGTTKGQNKQSRWTATQKPGAD